MISTIKDKLNNIHYDASTGNRKAGVMIMISKISDENFVSDKNCFSNKTCLVIKCC